MDLTKKELAFYKEEKRRSASELKLVNSELTFQNKEKVKRANELLIANKEKKNRADELIIADKELAFQKREKRKRADELTIANKELEFQLIKKKNRADELATANKELQFQNTEKRKRAIELLIAEKELNFQNKEKEKRADELVIANQELLFQNEEKEKRAAELIIANKELAFKNAEKEKRAAELIIANQELALQIEEKETQAAALESVNKELESFSYSVSHDLRAPLRAINGFTRILLDDYLDQLDAEAKEILEEIISNSSKMGHLIEDLLNFSRIGKQHVSMVDINMKELVDSVLAEQKQIEPARVINLTIKKIENIRGDRNMLKQVFINLISNAFKYTGKKKKAVIEIGSYHENDDCIYYVKDNGAGFDMRYYDKLFGVFQRLHSSNEFEGTGVGLTIIQKIITKHGGKVWAEAKTGEGACFYISLPATAQN